MSLAVRVAALLDDAVAAYEGQAARDRLVAARARLDEPLRVAIAGKVKAGKSTLLNALVGERLAPTDAGECTRVVTWYVGSHASRVLVHGNDGGVRQAPFRKDDERLHVELGTESVQEIDRIVVEWPSSRLDDIHLIDTPGIDSLTTEASARTRAFLTPEDEEERPADAVVYLMRHLHASDVGFLESFRDDRVAQATPINAVALLSRADEIGVGRVDAMQTAARIAARYRRDPIVRRMCQTVLPIAGLLAETATTLRQDEFTALARLAAQPVAETDALLLSADRFGDTDAVAAVDGPARVGLLHRLGLFGLRVALDALRSGRTTTAPALAAELRRTSGIDDLQACLRSQFAHRRDLLKARAAMVTLDAVLRESPTSEVDRLVHDLERLESSAHELKELRLLNALATGSFELDDADIAGRLLGGDGADVRARLGLGADADQVDVRRAAHDEVARWRRRAEHPLASLDQVEAARVLVRTCEGLVPTS